MSYTFMVDIEVYEVYGDDHWAQARYLAHGYDDIHWTNNLDSALAFIKEQITEQAEEY